MSVAMDEIMNGTDDLLFLAAFSGNLDVARLRMIGSFL